MRVSIVLLGFWVLLGLSACAAQPTPDFGSAVSNQVPVHQDAPGSGPHAHLDPALATASMQVVLVNSELITGLNRFAVGLLDSKGQAITDAQVHFHFYDLVNPASPLLVFDLDAARVATPDGLTVIYADDREFSHAGNWGVEVQARFKDGSAAIKRIGFVVVADSPSLKPGEVAPSLDTPTAASVNNDLSKITSATKPNTAFYQQSLAAALRSGKPTALLFATPAFCQTRFCGPMYEVTSDLQQRFAGRVNFIHVEVYSGLPNPAVNNFQLVPAMAAFGLHTEPWLILIGRDGTIRYRVEGVFSADELTPRVQQLLTG